MKILVHDYAGHPFQIQLSRQLALRGHEVTHAYFTDDPGPKGALHRRADDPVTLQFAGISIDRQYDKTSLIQRRFNDLEYGRRAGELIDQLRPDVVISGNTPTEAQGPIVRRCQASGAAFVYWVQDFYSIAASRLLRHRMAGLGRLVGWYYRWLERRQLRASDAVVVITEDFRKLAADWAGDPTKVHTIENWGALDDIPTGPKDNAWARALGPAAECTFLYSGTLGLKHNPRLLYRLAKESGPQARLAVVAQGVGMTRLEAEAQAHPVPGLTLWPLQPAARLPEVLASADVLVAVIEADAGTFSVPSKVQAYLCAGRAILLAAPAENLAARVVAREAAGLVVSPDDETAFLAAAARLQSDAALRTRLGGNGRAYAERAFDTVKIADAFEEVLTVACRRARARAGGKHAPEREAALRPASGIPLGPTGTRG